MFLRKKDLIVLIENFLFEKDQKVDKKFLKNIVKASNIKHNKTGIEYTVLDNIKNENENEYYFKVYRHDLDNPREKIYEKISYKDFEKEYSMV
jgi:hypothetical protein